MKFLNRMAFIVTPKEPYLRWAAGVDSDASEAAGELAGSHTIYLTSDDMSDGS